MGFEDWAGASGDGYFLRRFSMGEHAGTHLTAPATFYPDGRTVDGYQPGELVRPAVVIDTRERCRVNPDYALTVSDLREWEALYGKVPCGSLALLLTGWAELWRYPAEYLGDDCAGGLRFPGFGREAAALLMGNRGAAGLGVDTAGVEPGADRTFSVSRLVLASSGIVLENLANLGLLPPTGAIVVVGALPLAEGSGSPAAVTAFLPPGGS